MSYSLRLPRPSASTATRATLAGAVLAVGLAFAAPASASPVSAGPAVAVGVPGDGLLQTVQYWGPRPYGPPRYGWHRRHAWGGPRCTISYVRSFDRYRGIYVSRPVRRCW